MEGSWRCDASVLLVQKAGTRSLAVDRLAGLRRTSYTGRTNNLNLNDNLCSSTFQNSAQVSHDQLYPPLGPAPLRAHSHHLAEVNLGTNLSLLPSLWLYSTTGLVCCPARPRPPPGCCGPTLPLHPVLTPTPDVEKHCCCAQTIQCCSVSNLPRKAL